MSPLKSLQTEIDHIIQVAEENKEKRADPYYVALVACVCFNSNRIEEGKRFGYLLTELQNEQGEDSSSSSVTITYNI